MTQQSTKSESIIRITTEEANSPHVTDMLKRQASLRGEGGITRDRGGKWYYQNWFVLMIAGAIGAFGGWLLTEPMGGDYYQVDAKIVAVGPAASGPITYQGQQFTLTVALTAIAQVPDGEGSNENIYFTATSRKILPDGKHTKIEPGDLKVGQTIRVYAHPMPVENVGQLFHASFVQPDAPPLPGGGLNTRQWVKRQTVWGLLLFPIVASLVGLMVGATDGLMCRLWRRLLIGGLIGLAVGFVGGFISNIIANLVYAPLTMMAMKQSETGAGAVGDQRGSGLSNFGFFIQLGGRGLAWALAGMAMGLGQGLALRSKRLLAYGFLGGLIGGLLGGLLFDPIDLVLLGADKHTGAGVSRMIGFIVIGLTVGLMIGIVERLARDAWLRMVEGPLAGKEFLIFKDVMRMGASPRSEIYLFNDPEVAAQHALLRSTGDTYEIESCTTKSPVQVNGVPVQRSRLRHGDRISLGATSFVFQRQRGE